MMIRIDIGPGYERVQAAFTRMPAASARAMTRALRKLATWLRRQVLRAASQASGLPQKMFVQSDRFRSIVHSAGGRPVGLEVWVGTNPIPVHQLGTVRWTRRMAGARAGRKSYPGTWSWGRGKTGRAVMRRTGDARLPIERVKETIHPPILARLQSLEAEAAARFERLLTQELNYALNLEAGGAT